MNRMRPVQLNTLGLDLELNGGNLQGEKGFRWTFDRKRKRRRIQMPA